MCVRAKLISQMRVQIPHMLQYFDVDLPAVLCCDSDYCMVQGSEDRGDDGYCIVDHPDSGYCVVYSKDYVSMSLPEEVD